MIPFVAWYVLAAVGHGRPVHGGLLSAIQASLTWYRRGTSSLLTICIVFLYFISYIHNQWFV